MFLCPPLLLSCCHLKINFILLCCSLGDSSPHESMENWVDEKRQRREIANSNERRRMQSINSGFQSLRTLLPQCEGEKLSKVTNNLKALSFNIFSTFIYFCLLGCNSSTDHRVYLSVGTGKV